MESTYQDTVHTILPPSTPLLLGPLLLPLLLSPMSSTSSFAAASTSVPPRLSSEDRPRLRCALPFALGTTPVCGVMARN